MATITQREPGGSNRPALFLFPEGLGFILEGNHPLVYRWVRTTLEEGDDVLRRPRIMPSGETFGVTLHNGFARGGKLEAREWGGGAMAIEGREGSSGERGCALWPEDFGERLERFMEMAGLSRRDLAERLGVTEDAVGKWLKGAEPTGGDVWAMFQLSLGVPGGFPLLLYGDPHAKVGPQE